MDDQVNDEKAGKGKKGCLQIFVLILFVFVGIGFFIDDDTPQDKGNTYIKSVESSAPSHEDGQKIKEALANASVSRDAAQQNKLTYDILLPVNTVLTLSAVDVSDLMQEYLQNQEEFSKFDRTFIEIYAQGYETGLASLSYNAKTKETSVMNSQWDGYLCGVKALQDNSSVIFTRIKRFREEVALVGVELENAYENGQDFANIMEKGSLLNKEFDAFLDDYYKGECNPIFKGQYDLAVTRASSLLQSVRASKIIFDIESLKREISELSRIQL